MAPKSIPTLVLCLLIVVATIRHQLYCGAFSLSPSSWLTSKHQHHVNVRSPPARASRLSSRHRHSADPRPLTGHSSTGWPSAGFSPASGWSDRFEGELGASVSSKRGRGSQLLSMTAGVARQATSIDSTASTAGSRSVNWPLWYVLPIAPYQRRKTLMEEVVPGKVCGCPRYAYTDRVADCIIDNATTVVACFCDDVTISEAANVHRQLYTIVRSAMITCDTSNTLYS